MIATSWLAPDAGRANQDQAIRAAIDAGPHWSEYLRLLDRHGTPGLGWAALRRIPEITVPESTAQELRKRSDDCRKQAVVYCMVLGDVLKRLNRADLPAMPLKGQILSFDLYQDVGLRYTRDLDVEVRKEDLHKAQACLVGEDWQLEASILQMSPRQWDSFLRNEHSMTFIHTRSGCKLELHWRTQWETPEATTARWARSFRTEWQGCSIQAMSPGDLALYLCAHGCGHLWFRAKWAGDLARARATGLLDCAAAWNEARSTDQQNVLQVGLCLVDLLYGLPQPELPGYPGGNVQPFLIEIPLRALRDPKAPTFSTNPATFIYRIRLGRYQRALQTRESWQLSLSALFHSRKDFQTLPLPDSLFWAYKPLRPFLWLWRWSKQLMHRTPHQTD
jgi:hypothetical protein